VQGNYAKNNGQIISAWVERKKFPILSEGQGDITVCINFIMRKKQKWAEEINVMGEQEG
jgi:RNA-splicing ligase RtcB